MQEVDTAEKKLVYEYWNSHPCNSGLSTRERYTREYFDEIEEQRYRLEPYVWSFAQFARFHGKKVLEIGVGIGTDFIQWVRSGCHATGCDLTPAAVEYTKRRLAAYNLSADVRQEDGEHLSFSDESFDLVFCFGVIHHTPDPQRAVAEIYRVLKKGGVAKVMLYHRRSWVAFRDWVEYGLKKGRPFRSIDRIHQLYHAESPGTRVFSIQQAKELFRKFSKVDFCVQLTPYDFNSVPRILRGAVLAFSQKIGWNLLITAAK